MRRVLGLALVLLLAVTGYVAITEYLLARAASGILTVGPRAAALATTQTLAVPSMYTASPGRARMATGSYRCCTPPAGRYC